MIVVTGLPAGDASVPSTVRKKPLEQIATWFRFCRENIRSP